MSGDADALTAAYIGLERVLIQGLGRMQEGVPELVSQRVFEGEHIEFTVRMGDGGFIVCELVIAGGAKLELFRVELPRCARSLS